MKFHTLFALLLFAAGISAQNHNVTLRKKLTFTGQTLANVWGYTSGGHEYALVGASKGLIIIDITDPDNPQQIVQIPGPDNLWKEIKTYQHYAYIVSEGGQGLQIVDLANLPSSALNYHYFTGDSLAAGMNKIHALHIDTTKGFVYCYGGETFGGGAKIFDLKPDPYNPRYAGRYGDLGYIHDGYVDNDTLYGGHIYTGLFSIVNMSDKANPELINTQNTPGNFTHNNWLTPDHRTLLTTDEVNNSFLTAYDISDPTDIKLLDKIQSNPGSSSMVHNTHILDNNFAVTSWYKDGFTIVDVSRPGNLVQVGDFDTYSASGGGSAGCWGVYPFFPSGTAIASNIKGFGINDGELYIVTPTYVRACWLEGTITDAATGFPVFNAAINVIGTSMQENSAQNGKYAVGQVTPGLFTVQVSKAGYQPFEATVLLENGVLKILDVLLFPEGSLTIKGNVVRATDATVVSNAAVWLYGMENSYSATTDMDGNFSISGVSPGIYDVTSTETAAGTDMLYQQTLVHDSTLLLKLYPLYRRNEPAYLHGLFKFEHIGLSATPNPFNGSTQIDYTFSATGEDRLIVYNAVGQMVQSTDLDNASNTIRLGRDLQPGVYFVRLECGGEVTQMLKIVKM